MRISDWSSDVCSSDLGDSAHHRAVDRPALYPDAADAAGEGAADPRRRAAEPPRQKGHAHHGRADDPDRADDLRAVVDGPVQSLRLGLPVRSEEHTSTPVTNAHLVCRLLLEKTKTTSTH